MKSSSSSAVFKYFWKKFNKYPIAGWTTALAGIISMIFSGVLIPVLLKNFFDTIYSAGGGGLSANALDGLYLIVLFIGLAYLGRIVFKFLNAFITTVALEPKIFNDMERDAFNKIHSLSVDFFSETPIGGLVSKTFRLQGSFVAVFMGLVQEMIGPSLQFVIVLILIFLESWQLAVIYLVWGIIVIAVAVFLVKYKMFFDRIRARAESAVGGWYADTATNYMSVKLFSAKNREGQAFDQVLKARTLALVKSWHISTFITFVQMFLLAGVEIIILWYSVKLWHAGRIDVGTIVLIQTALLALSPYVLTLGNTLKKIFRATTNCEEIIEILNLEPGIKDPEYPQTSRISQGDISMKDISFTYDQTQAVFSRFDLSVPSGQKLGLVGYSGSGKSTLTKLLLRLMDPQSGSILIDGQSIDAITQDDLRRSISYVPQDPILFHRSIKENIAYGKPDASHEEIASAAKKANAHDFIIDIADGYDATVGERGVKLSGGERQRIAIARAMLKESPILILDEATSSLDTISEQYIQQAFDRLMKGRTTIVVAHRLSTVQKLDRIIVLDKGSIVEDGSPDELLALNGVYTKLWNTQHDGVLGRLDHDGV